MMTPRVSALPTSTPQPQRAADAVAVADAKPVPSAPWGLPEWFAVAQVAGPAILYLPGTQVFRAPLRFGVFGLSLFGLVWCFRRSLAGRVHPSCWLLFVAAIYMAVMISHPATNTVMVGLAQIGMHLAVAAPLFWAPPYFRGDPARLVRILTILWVLNGASVIVGILQVRDPATWMPTEFSTVMKTFNNTMEMYQYRTADGRLAIRPPGLGDAPGAACGAGMFVGITALAFLGLPVSRFRRAAGLAMGLAGVVIIFLSHVRSALVVLVGCAAVYSILLALQGRLKTVLILALFGGALGTCSIIYVESLGGRGTLDRFATLLADDPTTVFESSGRMSMVINAFDTLLVEYPLGAGLGRWGMMRRYFGDDSNIDSPEIWSEVQFSSWILDGGFVLLSLYLFALAVALWRVVRASFAHRGSELGDWGPVILMLSSSAIALLFSYTPFNSQMGIQFWFLIGAFEGLEQGPKVEAKSGRRPT